VQVPAAGMGHGSCGEGEAAGREKLLAGKESGGRNWRL
jgi:hypothetical protein